MASALSVAIPTIELTAGAFILLGLLTPIAAALGLVVTLFMAAHEAITTTSTVFDVDPAMLIAILLAGLALALQFTGPGHVSLDFGRSWARRPLVSSWIWVILGIAGAVALWYFGTGINPFV